MSKKNFKRITAITLAAVMTLGSTVMAFATTPGSAEGTGSYEGGELKYPTISITLPTIPAGTYDYIADPNGLIAATNNEKYQGSTFEGNTGIFFLTDSATKKYTGTSAALKVTNENAQDIDVTVKLEQKTAGDESIQYSSSSTFENSDTVNKLYLAVTDGAASDPKTAALSTTAATLTTKVAGVPGNYEASYNSTDSKYEYKKKADATGWKECSFALTGALNKNATWGDDLSFPTIQVTWSYAEHQEGPTVTFSKTGLLSISGLSADNAFVKVTIPYNNGTSTYAFNTSAATWSPSAPKADSTGDFTCQLNNAWVQLLSGSTTTATLTYTNSAGETKTVTSTPVTFD